MTDAQKAAIDANGGTYSIDQFMKENPGLPASLAYTTYSQLMNDYAASKGAADTSKAAADLSTNYSTAMGSLQQAEKADVGEFQRTSPLLQRKMIGSLNSRGLGTSMNTITGQTPSFATYPGGVNAIGQSISGGPPPGSAIYGSGNAGLQNLIAGQASDLSKIQGGYQSMANDLEKQKAADSINLDAFNSQLAQQRAYYNSLWQKNQPSSIDGAKFLASMFTLN